MEPQITIQSVNQTEIAILENEGIAIQSAQDALDFIANGHYMGVSYFIIRKDQLNPDFFDLKTGLAGDILQKFSNYQSQLAILGDFGNIESRSLSDFIRESNKTGRIVFGENVEDAMGRWSA